MKTKILGGIAAIALLIPMAATPLAMGVENDPVPSPTRTITSPGNPIIKDGSLYTADAAPMVGADGRLYIHTGHDEASPSYGSFQMKDYVVLATDDVASGQWDVYEKNLEPGKVFSWATGDKAYAGQALRGADGRYYWYVPIGMKNPGAPNDMAIGVAVADTPVGPWSDAKGSPLITWKDVFGSSSNGQEVIDPHTFIDDDGRVYLYWGSWNIARGVELEADMVTRKGDIQQWGTNQLTGFFEAPWVFNRNGTYYMAYDWKVGGSECTPSNYQACIAYATSSSPMGPWKYQGIILGGSSATTVHPSLIEFDNQWYITYHTKDAVGGGHFRRSVAIDTIEWDGDTILPVKRTLADDPAYRLMDNVAPDGKPSASFTETPPMRVGALNDGRVSGAMLPPDQWGNYRGTSNSVASDWIMYEWPEATTVNSMGIMFHRDGNWIRPPASWRLEYLGVDGTWKPLETSATPTATDQWHTVTFDTVQATALRMHIDGLQNATGAYHSVSVSEWEVYAVTDDVTAAMPTVYTKVGEAPQLPAAVKLSYLDVPATWAPVRWFEGDPQDYAAVGEYTVKGRASGYAADYVEAKVIVTADGIAPPGTDDEKPTAVIELLGTMGQDDWYSSEVTPRIRAYDNVDYAMTIFGRADEGAWVAKSDVRYLDLPKVSGDGTHTVLGKAEDSSGNVSDDVLKTFKIDRTAPTVTAELDQEARTVTVTATDALSGIATFEYRLDDGAWTEGTLGQAVAATTGAPQKFAYRVTDKAGNIRQGTIDIPRDPNEKLTGNIAPFAKGTSSYVTGWNSNNGLNDGDLELFKAVKGKEGAAWGTWDRVGTQWVQLDWAFEVTTDAVGVWWMHDQPDSSKSGVVPPREWKLQYLADGEWVDAQLVEGTYGRERDVFNVVEFAPVSTTALRVTAVALGEAAGQGSIGINEWHVRAADVPAPELTEVTPAAPELVPATGCGVEATVSVPSVEGVVYSSDQVGTAVTVMAVAAEGFVLKEGVQASWSFDVKAEVCPPVAVEVVPSAPELMPASGCGVEATVSVPEVEGVVYSSDRVGTVVKVTAVAAEGFVLKAGAVASWSFDVKAEVCPPGPIEVTPALPVLIPAVTCGVEPVIVVPPVEGVLYSSDRVGTVITVTARAAEGFVLKTGAPALWSFDVKAEVCGPVDPGPGPGPGLSVPKVSFERHSGDDRYGTSLAVNEKAMKAGAPLFVATGGSFADALSVGSAVAARDGSLVLAASKGLDAKLVALIKSKAPSEVFLIGGTSSVPSAVESQLKTALGAKVSISRVEGKDRYATSVAIVQKFFPKAPTVFVATGRGYPDALSAAGAAGSLGAPVLLVDGASTKPSAETTAVLTGVGAKTIHVVGGSSVVKDSVVAGLGAKRLSGPDRYATNVEVNAVVDKVVGKEIAGVSDVWLASGANFPDALSAGAEAGKGNQRLYLTPGTCIPRAAQAVLDTKSALKARAVHLVGGENLLSKDLITKKPVCNK